jgi:hypothetical protein
VFIARTIRTGYDDFVDFRRGGDEAVGREAIPQSRETPGQEHDHQIAEVWWPCTRRHRFALPGCITSRWTRQ